jgi:hypothetical protein
MSPRERKATVIAADFDQLSAAFRARHPEIPRTSPTVAAVRLGEKLEAATDLVSIARADLEAFDVLAVLRTLDLLVQTAELGRRSAVELLRSKGATWDRIGQEFGITRQAAQQRFSV